MTAISNLPARRSNPFATCWTRPGALPFVPTRQTTLQQCLQTLNSNGWRGQILGPHGAGKSTLLKAIAQAAVRLEIPAVWMRARDGRARPLAGFPMATNPARRPAALIDSFEGLACWRRWAWRAAPSGLVVTSHRPIGLPTLAVLRPSVADAVALFHRLTERGDTPVGLKDLRYCYKQRRGNLREVWFDLYDLHERRTRRPTNQRQSAKA